MIDHQEAVAQTCSVKKVLLEISQNSQEHVCARVSFLINLQAPPVTLLKKRVAQAFSCKFREISKNTFFHITPLVAASDHHKVTTKLVHQYGRAIQGIGTKL